MKKYYMFKNCPCYDKDYEECLNTPRDVYEKCLDIEDCLLKQIADKLNCFWCDAVGKSYDEEERQAYINQKIDDILNLFDIEEIEVCEDE